MLTDNKFRLISVFLLFAILLVNTPGYANVTLVPTNEYAKINQTFTMLDISEVANRAFIDEVQGDGKGGWTDQGPTNDLSSFKITGKTNLMGIDFNIIDPLKNEQRSCIVLRGKDNMAFPTKVEIPVNAKGAGVYFLHACAHLRDNVGIYRFVYEDGTEEAIPIVGKRDIFDWWGINESDYSVTAWSGTNDSSVISLNIFACVNPHPNKLIKKIVAETDGSNSYLMIVAATLTDSGPYLPKDKTDLGNPDTSDWFPYEYVDYADDIQGTPLDVSFLLDAPAGKHGRVKAVGDQFVFEDGTPVQFWGINVTSDKCAPSYEDAIETAKRLSQLGFNLVRFHMLDNPFISERSIFAIDDSSRRSTDLNPKVIDRLCFLINELKKRGIYYLIDLSTQRNAFDDDNVQDAWSMTYLKGAPVFFDQHIRDMQKEFDRKILECYNPYTKMKIKDDPAYVLSDLNNETSLVNDAEIKSEYYMNQLKKLYNEWLIKKYKTRDALKEAWEDDEVEVLRDSEDPFKGTVEVYARNGRIGLKRQRLIDNLAFLADVQIEYFKDRTDYIHELGCDIGITGTTVWGKDELVSIYSLAMSSDFIDTHFYRYLTGDAKPPSRIDSKPITSMSNSSMGIIGFFSNRKVFGMPFTISEWNGGAPNPYASENLLLVAAYGRLQGWHPINFCWGQNEFDKRRQEDIKKDLKALDTMGAIDYPPILHAFPASALIFLRKDAKEATKGFYLTRYRNDDYFVNTSISNNANIGMIGKTGIIINEKAYDPDYNDNDILQAANEGDATGRYISSTGELLTDTNKKIFMLNTERSQAVSGFIGGTTISLNDTDITLDNKFATVYLSSLTDDPIWKSEKLLLTTPGRHKNTDELLTEDCTAYIREGVPPILIEPITGKIVIKRKDDIKVYALTTTGQRKFELKVTKTKEGYSEFTLTKDCKTMNYEIVGLKNNDLSPNPAISFGSNTYGDLFDDLNGYEWAEKEINRIYLQNLIKATSYRQFSPKQYIARGDFVKMLVNGLKLYKKAKEDFADVPESNENYNEIMIAKGHNVVKGDEANLFRPDELITFQDMIVMVCKALEEARYTDNLIEGNNLKEFDDKDLVAPYAVSSIDKVLNAGYLKYKGKLLNPLSNVARAEAAVVIYNILWK